MCMTIVTYIYICPTVYMAIVRMRNNFVLFMGSLMTLYVTKAQVTTLYMYIYKVIAIATLPGQCQLANRQSYLNFFHLYLCNLETF